MPRLTHPVSAVEALLRASYRILLDRGIESLTLRGLAADAGMGPPSVVQRFDNRHRLVHLLAQLAGGAWLAELAERIRGEGVLAFLPGSEDSLEHTRVWLSWCELARSCSVKGTVANVWAEERDLLAQAVADDPAPVCLRGSDPGEVDALDRLLALIHGLREATCASDAPMPVERARRLLEAHLADQWADQRAGQRAAASARARSSATIRSGSSAE